FNHSIHVKKGVGCVTCHGRVDQMAEIRQGSNMQMSWCLDCHRTPQPNLRPRQYITSMQEVVPGQGTIEAKSSEAGSTTSQNPATMYDAHPATSCTTCHR